MLSVAEISGQDIRTLTENVSKKKCETKGNVKQEYEYTYKLLGNKVCKQFFMNTLGVKSFGKIEKLVKLCENYMNSEEYEPYIDSVLNCDNRGKYKRKSQEFDQNIENFINSFNPQFSHYNIKNTPNRRYIDSSFSAYPTKLYNTFKEQNQNNSNYELEKSKNSCHYKYFNKKLKSLNIGFQTPSQDWCKICLKYKNHKEKSDNCNCKSCDNYSIHYENYKESRNCMNNDSELSKQFPKKVIVVSGDFQKVIPVLKIKIKENQFMGKILMYNQTFCEIGKNSNAFCYISNDCEIDKSANEFINFILQFIKSDFCKDAENIIIWFDNCSYANKNWLLFSALLIIINDYSIKLKMCM
jgi:hypothetical protein